MTDSLPMQLPSDVVRGLPLKEAVDVASRRGADFFPSRVGFKAADQDESYLRSLEKSLQRAYQPSPAELVPVPKWGGSTRPGADMSIDDRIVLDALCLRLRQLVVDGLVNWSLVGEERERAENALVHGDHSHVLVTDIVAFYEYVSRSRLLLELEELSGADQEVAALSSILDSLMGEQPGLPQGAPLVAILADVYLSIVDRQLARAGIEVVRWADDYRIPAASLRDATRISVALETALRSLNLNITAAKTWTPSVATYAKWVADQRVERKDFAELRARTSFEYELSTDEESEEEADSTLEVDAADEQVIEDAVSNRDGWQSSPKNYARSRRLQLVLPQLGLGGSSVPLRQLTQLMERYPHLMRDIAGYLRRRIFAGYANDTVAAIGRALVHQEYAYAWQQGWLLHALVPVDVELPTDVVQIARDALHAPNSMGFVRGRAALILASEGELPTGKELDLLYSMAPPAARPDFVAAVSRWVQGRDRDLFLREALRDPLLSAVAKTAPGLHPFLL